ncbi:MAG: M42 family metallopeptidase [Chloroflexi bacterium]|nr:M42 family metallopeptidase [Chloroflexota bacterium]
MPELLPFLKELVSAPGLSGHENPVAAIIRNRWKPLVDEIHSGKLGSLHGLHKGTAPAPRPSVMVCTHMDAIGLMVTGIKDGFLRLTNVGGVDARVLPGQLATVHATGAGTGAPSPLPAVVAQPPARLLPDEIGSNPAPLEYLLADTGLPPKKVAELVRVGDLVSYATEPVELAGDVICGHTLDNRSSVAALTICLEELQNRPHAWDVWAVATVQEETGLAGAYTSTYQIRPSLAIAVDVTWAKGPGSNDWNTVPIGKGPALCMGPDTHPALFKGLVELADKLELPYLVEYAPRHTGTDAFATQVSAEGVPSVLISIPLRYMHTPVEVVALKDIQRAGRLMAEFIAGLTPDYLDKIVWDD